jgi:flagellar hook-basal body complex protein FliE
MVNKKAINNKKVNSNLTPETEVRLLRKLYSTKYPSINDVSDSKGKHTTTELIEVATYLKHTNVNVSIISELVGKSVSTLFRINKKVSDDLINEINERIMYIDSLPLEELVEKISEFKVKYNIKFSDIGLLTSYHGSAVGKVVRGVRAPSLKLRKKLVNLLALLLTKETNNEPTEKTENVVKPAESKVETNNEVLSTLKNEINTLTKSQKELSKVVFDLHTEKDNLTTVMGELVEEINQLKNELSSIKTPKEEKQKSWFNLFS